MSEIDKSKVEREAALSGIFASLGAVAQAGTEQGLNETVLIDLQAETTDRAREIYQQTAE